MHGVGLFDSRERLKAGLSRYAEHRAAGPAGARLAWKATGRHISILSSFYRWAIAEGHAEAEPFTYRFARALFAGTGRGSTGESGDPAHAEAARDGQVPGTGLHRTIPRRAARAGAGRLAGQRIPRPGTGPQRRGRRPCAGDRAAAAGVHLPAAVGGPPAAAGRATAPIPFPVPAAITKGRKFRTTWNSYEALAAVHDYLELDRAATAEGSGWRPPRRWGEPLHVTDPRPQGGRVNGVRSRFGPPSRPPTGGGWLRLKAGRACWRSGTAAARSRPGPRSSSGPRTASQLEPRFPHVWPHRLRHTFSMRTLEYLVSGQPQPEARPGHRRQRGAHLLPVQGRPAAHPPAPARAYLHAHHGKVPPAPGYHSHLPGGLRGGRDPGRPAQRR